MSSLRLLLASLAAVLLVGLGAVVALAAPAAVTKAASTSGGAAHAVYCPPGAKKQLAAQLARFEKSMAKSRAAYFRTHPRTSQRTAFIRAQVAQLKTLQKKLARCS